MSAAVIVLAGPVDVAKEVEGVCDLWARAGLLRPVLWVDRDPAVPATETTVTRFEPGSGPQPPVRLLDELARGRITVVRLVSVHLLATTQADPAVTEETERLAGVLAEAVSDRQDVERLNVLVPAGDARDIPPEIVKAPTVKHVLVSPEDRLTDAHASAGVAYPRNYATHAALGLAAVSGALVPMPDAPFDGVQLPASSEKPPVVVVRPFGRLLRAGGLTDRVMSEVFVRRRVDAWTASAAGAVNAPNPAAVVVGVAGQLEAVQDRATSYRPPSPPPEPARGRSGILAAFGMMLRFVLRRLQDVPSQVAVRVTARARQAVEEVAQKATFGPDSLVQVSVGGRERGDRPLRSSSRYAVDFATELLRSVGVSTTPPSTAGLWRTLRGVSFGLIDGGPFPSGVEPPMDGARRLVLNDPGSVVEDVSARFAPDLAALPAPAPDWAAGGVTPWDPRGASDLRDLLAEERRRVAEEGEEGEESEEALAAFEAVLGDLDTWAGQRSHTLLWKFGARLAGSLREAAAHFADALRTVDAGPPAADPAAQQRARRWLRRLLVAGFAVALLASVASRTLGVPGLAPLPWPVVVAIGLAVWFGWWFASFFWYQRRMFQLQYELDRRHHRYLSALRRAEHDALEVVRLAALYDQFVDWAAIIAWMLHHPEGPSLPEAESARCEPAPLPNALGVAEGTPSEATIQRASAIVGRSIFRVGWLSELYGNYHDNAMAALKHVLGMREDERDFDPDTDLAAPTPREYLLDRLVDGTCAARWHRDVRDQVETELAKLPPDDLVDHLEVWQTSAGVRDEVLTARAFLAELLPDAGQKKRTLLSTLWVTAARVESPQPPEGVAHIRLWAPPGMLAHHGVERVTLKAASAQGGPGSAVLRGVVRVDSALPCPPDDLAPFGPGEGPPPPPPQSAWDQGVG